MKCWCTAWQIAIEHEAGLVGLIWPLLLLPQRHQPLQVPPCQGLLHLLELPVLLSPVVLPRKVHIKRSCRFQCGSLVSKRWSRGTASPATTMGVGLLHGRFQISPSASHRAGSSNIRGK